ncbi:hypothetical protein NDU88_004741 [Pleurodeles waltl]|uniref:Uncharacterized protein n=1 Tax=Pleurodeles waltl TaxID=8319 RepID=A0AAV7SJP1_PLEWA|nr:hypothetical protein NDU88_004741 [Pleurodeles waltl]
MGLTAELQFLFINEAGHFSQYRSAHERLCFTGKPVKRLQSFDGLTQQQILTRVEWFVAEMKKHDVIDEKANMDCQSIALRNVDHVLKFLWKLIEHDIWFTWESSCQLQDTDADVVCSVPFQWTPEVKPTLKENAPAPRSALSMMASLEELENLSSPLSSVTLPTETQPSNLNDLHPFPGHELSKTYNKKIPKGGWRCYPSSEKCIIDLINGLLKVSCKDQKLKVKTLQDLMDSCVMCSVVNAFLPKTFPLEVLLNDRWTINMALKTLEALLRVSTSFSSDDLVKAEPQALCAYVCFIFMAGYKYKQSRTVAESMKKLHLEIEEITFRLKTFSSEKLDTNQFAEKNSLQQRLMEVVNGKNANTWQAVIKREFRSFRRNASCLTVCRQREQTLTQSSAG